MPDHDPQPGDDEIVIALVLRSSSDPIDGTIALAGGQPEPFTGWMQLIQLLSRQVNRLG